MQLDYNIYLELAVIPLDITLIVFLFAKRKEQTTVNTRFRQLSLLVTITNIVDILTAVVLSQHTLLPNICHMLITSLNCMFSSCTAFAFVLYIQAYVDELKYKRFSVIFNRVLLISLAVLIVQNFLTHNIFYFDEDGNYIGGLLFILVLYVYPALYIIYGIVTIVVHSKCFRSPQKWSLAAALVFLNIMFVLQIAVLHDVLVTYFAASVSLLILFLSLEATDNAKLSIAMRELEKAKEEEAAAKMSAIEANDIKTKFLSQMSHEIRTPINAIMGYSSLIMEDTEETSTREYSRKSNLAARRLLDFFESVFEFIAVEGGDDSMSGIDHEEYEDFDALETGDKESTGRKTVPAESMKLLVVDDTEMNVELLTRILAAMGFQTDTAPDGERALEKIRSNKYDLIFMDHMMPVMDGMEAMRVIKAEKLCADVPIIMVTANTVKGEREKYLSAGFTEYVTKPFSEESIREVLLKHLPIDEEQLKRATWSVEWRNLQKSLPFLRISAAREYCLADEKLFLEVLKSYVMNNALGELEEYMESADYFNYRAVLASFKDTSALIGADRIKEKAANIERYYLRGNFEEIKIKHVVFYEEAKKLLRQISEAMFMNDTDVEAASNEHLDFLDSRPLILVIDDDRVVCGTIESILSKHYRVKMVATGEEGIIKAQEYNPALIMIDLKLEGIGGFEVMRALRSVEETADIPLVLMTSDEDGEKESLSIRNGATDFIRKPFAPEVLYRRISRIMELTALQKHLKHEITRQTENVAKLSREVMLALSKAVDAKDHYTNDHSQRVAKYSVEIAKQLGKTKSEQDDLYIMGLLHDVGKIGVNEDIINKPSRLTDEEYAQIKKHTVIGYEILKIVTEMPDVAKAARWHHERYDGRGYPDGISGTDIPEEARIICMADSYDAMTSQRPYQGLRKQSDVRSEIIRCKGTQFDPTIADAMIRIIDEDKNYTLHE